MSNAPQVLIIGCGYVGLRAAVRWLESGSRVSALTRSPERAQQLYDLGIQPILGDVTQPESLGLLPSVDIVLHAVGLDRRAGHSQREVYVNGLENVLERIAGRTGRLIYVSSTSVYGQNSGEIVDETSLCAPATPNGTVCLEAERLLSRFFHVVNSPDGTAEVLGHQASANILRLAGIYGPHRLIARVASLRSGEVFTGNPEAWLNLIHVDDAVSAILACAQRGHAGESYLVSDDRPIHRREYYEELAKLVNAPRPQFGPVSDADRIQLNKRCSNRRMRHELGVELKFPDILSGLPHALIE